MLHYHPYKGFIIRVRVHVTRGNEVALHLTRSTVLSLVREPVFSMPLLSLAIFTGKIGARHMFPSNGLVSFGVCSRELSSIIIAVRRWEFS